MSLLQRGHSGDGYDLASTLFKYDLRKGDFFVPSWERVRRVRREVSSELLMCAQYFVIASCDLMPRDNRCIYIYIYIYVCFYVCCSDCVNVCCVAAVVKNSGFGALECLCSGCDVFCLYIALLVYLFVLCVCVNCLVKQFAIYFGVIAILLWNVMAVFSVGGGALLDRPCMVFKRMCVWRL